MHNGQILLYCSKFGLMSESLNIFTGVLQEYLPQLVTIFSAYVRSILALLKLLNVFTSLFHALTQSITCAINLKY